MSSIQGPAKQGAVEMKALVAKLLRHFELPGPVKRALKDGSNEQVSVQHRFGRDGGCLTKSKLFALLGFEREYAEFLAKQKRNLTEKGNLDMVARAVKKSLNSRMLRVVSEVRKILEVFYMALPRPLLPMFAFVPVAEKEEGLYLQGLQDASTDLPVYFIDFRDVRLWTDKTFASTKKQADMNARSRRTARQSMGLPGINKDLVFHFKQIADGIVPPKLGYIEPEEQGKEKK